MKKFCAIVILFIILFGLVGFVFAQARELEVDYPEVQGEKPEQVTTPVPEYVKYIFNFLIAISGVIALGVLVYAGFQYFTSTGNIEKISDAKSRITAALLGLVILFGSYLILYSINPDLIVFHLPRLRPILSELPSGVLACQQSVNAEIEEAWNITINYPSSYAEEDLPQKAKRLNQLLDAISLNCYTITTAGDIRPDFDNKITDIYIIPGVKNIGGNSYATTYGAIIYEERNFMGQSRSLIPQEHLTKVLGLTKRFSSLNIKVSSIKPFTIQWDPDPNWKVTLYQEYNYNQDLPQLEPKTYQFSTIPCSKSTTNLPLECEVRPLPFSPKSLKIEGDILIILFTDDKKSDVFFSESDANLEDNLNIVEWIDCALYKSGTTKKCEKKVGTIYYQQTITINCCAQAAATRMRIISAKIY